MGKKVTVALLLLLVLCLLAPPALQRLMDDPQGDILPEELGGLAPQTPVPVSPVSVDPPQEEQQAYTLYFRYLDTAYLSQETRAVIAPLHEPLEMTLVRALVRGPSASHAELGPLFPADVEVLECVTRDGVTYVTLSEDFLMAPADAPEDWMNYDYWRREIATRRQLALLSIVNTLTEVGGIHQVQLLAASEGTVGEGERIPRSFFEPGIEDQTLVLEPVARNEATILTARNMLLGAFEAWQNKDWLSLYQYLAADSDEGLPSQSAFQNDMAERGRSLLNYQVSGGTLTGGRDASILTVTVQMMEGDGQVIECSQYPVRAVIRQDCWKLPYGELVYLMGRQ